MNYELLSNGGVEMWVPCLPAPKGSSRAVQIPIKGRTKCRVCGVLPTRVAWIAGSADSGKEKQKGMETAIRAALLSFVRDNRKFTAYNGPVKLDAHFIFEAPASRRKACQHVTYPDRDKLLRMLSDCITPPVKNKTPDLDAPHLLVNDSMACQGNTAKWYLHTWNRLYPEAAKDEAGVLFRITPLEDAL